MTTTAAKAAVHLCMSPSRFRDLLDEGVIERQTSRGYDLDVVRRQYIEHIRKIAAGHGKGGGANLAEQRAKLAAAQTQAALFKNGIAAGNFADLALTKRLLESMFSAMREQALGLSGKISDSLTPHCEEDRAAICDTIRREVCEMLEALSVTHIVAASASLEKGPECRHRG